MWAAPLAHLPCTEFVTRGRRVPRGRAATPQWTEPAPEAGPCGHQAETSPDEPVGSTPERRPMPLPPQERTTMTFHRAVQRSSSRDTSVAQDIAAVTEALRGDGPADTAGLEARLGSRFPRARSAREGAGACRRRGPGRAGGRRPLDRDLTSPHPQARGPGPDEIRAGPRVSCAGVVPAPCGSGRPVPVRAPRPRPPAASARRRAPWCPRAPRPAAPGTPPRRPAERHRALGVTEVDDGAVAPAGHHQHA